MLSAENFTQSAKCLVFSPAGKHFAWNIKPYFMEKIRKAYESHLVLKFVLIIIQWAELQMRI